jgi:hypothetical protein
MNLDTLPNGTTITGTDQDGDFKFRKTSDRWWLIVANTSKAGHLRSEMYPGTVRQAITEAANLKVKGPVK